jgi:hypothetical protein
MAEIDNFLSHNHLWSEKILFDDSMKDFSCFMTAEGLLGFGPQHVEVGDSIFVFLGGEVPHLLRKAENEIEYSFVGECYVQGLMKGEGFLKARKIADPSYDLSDTAWLERLHEEIPFPMADLVIR